MEKFSIKKIGFFLDDWDSKIEDISFSVEALKYGNRDIIKFNFVYERDKYDVLLKMINDNGDYKGDIICNTKKVGFCFYTIYKNKTRTILVGEWIQNGEKWPSIIELIK